MELDRDRNEFESLKLSGIEQQVGAGPNDAFNIS